mgnify:CR=1 FL=1
MTALIQLENITKTFAGVHALTDVDFDLKAGEVHALVGENGAGKSTLMRVLGGEMRPNAGRTLIEGEEIRLAGPTDAIRRGISVIHQEMALAPDLSVAENIFLGALPQGINWSRLNERARILIERLGFQISPRAQVADLAVAHQQVVEIAKALSRDVKAIVFDEPTAVLASGDAERLLEIIKGLRAEGVGIVYISHRLDEIYKIADRITVMKDGQRVGTVTPASTPVEDLIRMMVGRPLSQLFGDKPETTIGEEVLRIDGLTLPNGVRDVSFSIRRGEVVGLGGLVGSGRTEVARAIFGADRITGGAMHLKGAPYSPRSPRHAVKQGVGLVPEDRKSQGVVLDMEIRKNATMASTGPITRAGFFRPSAERGVVERLIQSLRIKLGSMNDPVSSLSGGNQQRIVLAKWLATEPKLLILDSPTVGVDVGARAGIFEIVKELAGQGMAILLISDETPEVYFNADRVLLMRDGELVDEFVPAKTDLETMERAVHA